MKLNELFNVIYGSNLELSNVEESDIKNGIPFVSRTEKNKGISAYIVKQSGAKLNPSHTLSVALGGTVLETFYQEKEYYSGRDIAYLKPIIDMTKEQMIYYAICIKANKIKYSYGRQANRTLKDIELPNLKDLPTWILSTNYTSLNYQKNNSVAIENNLLKPFLISNLFDVVKGKSINIGNSKNDMGKTPIVSASEKNNGITAFTNELPLFKENCLTLATNGSVGECFYQPQDFISTSDTTVLIPKIQFNKYIGIYISTILRKEGKTKYSYGRKWDLEAVKNTVILLPTIDNLPNFQFIENYIKNIEKRYNFNIENK